MTDRISEAVLAEIEHGAICESQHAGPAECRAPEVLTLVTEIRRLREIIDRTAARIPYAREAMDDEAALIRKEKEEKP